MSDNMIDKACEVEAQLTEAALNDQKRKAERDNLKMKPTGKCFYCEDKLTDPTHRFCNTDCRDDYDRESRLRSRMKG